MPRRDDKEEDILPSLRLSLRCNEMLLQVISRIREITCRKGAPMSPTVLLPITMRMLALVLLAMSLWLFSPKGCVPDQETNPRPALSVATPTEQCEPDPSLACQGIPISIKDDTQTESSRTPHQSLKNAAVLLNKAADVLDTDELVAVQLIRHVISILKYTVIPSLLEPERSLAPIGPSSNMTDSGMVKKEQIAPLI